MHITNKKQTTTKNNKTKNNTTTTNSKQTNKSKKRSNLQAILYPRMTNETRKLTAMSLSYKTMRTNQAEGTTRNNARVVALVIIWSYRSISINCHHTRCIFYIFSLSLF